MSGHLRMCRCKIIHKLEIELRVETLMGYKISFSRPGRTTNASSGREPALRTCEPYRTLALLAHCPNKGVPFGYHFMAKHPPLMIQRQKGTAFRSHVFTLQEEKEEKQLPCMQRSS